MIYMSDKAHSKRRFLQWPYVCRMAHRDRMAREYTRNFYSLFPFSLNFLLLHKELWGAFSIGWSKTSASHCVYCLLTLISVVYSFMSLSHMEWVSCFLVCKMRASFPSVTVKKKPPQNTKISQFLLRELGSVLQWTKRVHALWDFSPTIWYCNNFVWDGEWSPSYSVRVFRVICGYIPVALGLVQLNCTAHFEDALSLYSGHNLTLLPG